MVLFLSGLVNGLGRAVSSGIDLMNAKYFIVSDSAEDIITVSNIDSKTYESLQTKFGQNITTLDIQRMYLQTLHSEEKINVTYFAIEPGSFIEPTILEGSNLSDSNVSNAIVLNDDFMTEGISLNDTILDSSTNMEFVVVGFTKD